MDLEVMLNIWLKYWPMFMRGAGRTLLVAIVGTVVGSLIGLIIGVIRTIPEPERGFKKVLLKIINGIISIYIEVFRGTPMMVQAMVVYFGSTIAFGIDMQILDAALVVISINTGAYMAEIVRGGIISVDSGQYEAAQAIGMTHFQTMLNVILPQAIRNILPATANEFIINIKDSSVLSVIGMTELFYQSKSIAGATFKYFEVFLITSIIYLTMTVTISRALRYLEKRMDGSDSYDVMGNQMQVETPDLAPADQKLK